MDKLINKMWYYPYSAVLFCHKKNEVLIHVTTWINTKNILSEEVRHTTLHTVTIPFEMSRTGKFIVAENILVVARNG